MTFPVAQQTLVVVLLASLRTTAWILVAPPFATSGLPRTVRVMLGVLFAVVVAPTITADGIPSTTAGFVSAGFLQVVVGVALGFAVRMVFAAVESAGALLDVVGGFSLSFAFDPMGNQSTSVLARFHGMLATVLLMVTPAHQVLVLGLLRSFRAVPLDGTLDVSRLGSSLTTGIGQLFVATLQIAGPLVLVLFLADVALGLLNRVAPQLNAFSLSFPLKIALTLVLIGGTFALLPGVVRGLADRATDVVSFVTG